MESPSTKRMGTTRKKQNSKTGTEVIIMESESSPTVTVGEGGTGAAGGGGGGRTAALRRGGSRIIEYFFTSGLLMILLPMRILEVISGAYYLTEGEGNYAAYYLVSLFPASFGGLGVLFYFPYILFDEKAGSLLLNSSYWIVGPLLLFAAPVYVLADMDRKGMIEEAETRTLTLVAFSYCFFVLDIFVQRVYKKRLWLPFRESFYMKLVGAVLLYNFVNEKDPKFNPFVIVFLIVKLLK